MKKQMRKIVRGGYEKGDYASAYRMSDKPNGFEGFWTVRFKKCGMPLKGMSFGKRLQYLRGVVGAVKTGK